MLPFLLMFVPTDPQLSLFFDNVWPMISTAVVGCFIWWRNSAVTKEKHEILLTQVKGEIESIRKSMNGLGERIGKVQQEQYGLRTMLTGLDGTNGMKSEVRELLVETKSLSKSVTRLESDYTNTIRRLDELENAS